MVRMQTWSCKSRRIKKRNNRTRRRKLKTANFHIRQQCHRTTSYSDLITLFAIRVPGIQSTLPMMIHGGCCVISESICGRRLLLRLSLAVVWRELAGADE